MNAHIIELIKITIGKQESFQLPLTSKDWDVAFEEAKKQTLIGVLFAGLEKLPKHQLPPRELLLKWFGIVEHIKKQNRLFDIRAKELTDFMKTGGFRSTLLKGQGLALLYPNPALRQCGDIDLLVDGNRKSIVDYCQKSWTIDHADYKNVVITNFPDVHVEVHFVPSWFYCPFTERKFRSWYHSVSDKQFENCIDKGFCLPTISFNLVFLMIHIYKHQFDEGIGLRQLMDYYYVLVHSNKKERNDALLQLSKFRMERFVSAVMYVMEEVFSLDHKYMLCLPSEKYGKKLLSDIISGGNFGHYNENNIHGKENRIKRGIRNIKHNLRLILDYPKEVIWSPVWKCWHWVWRKYKGYL